jgi:hypothetical protein
MPGLQDTRRGILQTQINRCTSNVTPSPACAGYDGLFVLLARRSSSLAKAASRATTNGEWLFEI